jgi:hypothetical protein
VDPPLPASAAGASAAGASGQIPPLPASVAGRRSSPSTPSCCAQPRFLPSPAVVVRRPHLPAALGCRPQPSSACCTPQTVTAEEKICATAIDPIMTPQTVCGSGSAPSSAAPCLVAICAVRRWLPLRADCPTRLPRPGPPSTRPTRAAVSCGSSGLFGFRSPVLPNFHRIQYGDKCYCGQYHS